MHRRALRMSPRDARRAEMQERTLADPKELCIQLLAQLAVQRLSSHLSLRKAVLYIAANVMLSSTLSNSSK